MANHNELGIQGEKMAVAFLRKKGYSIRARNYRFKHLEIDIVAEYENKLIIVEVKTRNSDYLADPYNTISKTKQRNLIQCANAFLHENELDCETQFDIISIQFSKAESKIEHLEDAFYPI